MSEQAHRLAALKAIDRFQQQHGLTGGVVKEVASADRVDFVGQDADGRKYGIGYMREKPSCQ